MIREFLPVLLTLAWVLGLLLVAALADQWRYRRRMRATLRRGGCRFVTEEEAAIMVAEGRPEEWSHEREEVCE